MVFSLDMTLIVQPNRANILTAVDNLMPSRDDVTVWGGQYDWREYTDIETGNYVLTCAIRFNTDADRLAKLNALKGLTGIINACEVGSIIKTHLCDHDDPAQGCTNEVIELRKT